MEKNKRNSISDYIHKYCHFSNSDEDFMELTEWTNGEGVDVMISHGSNSTFISLSYGQLDMMVTLSKLINVD